MNVLNFFTSQVTFFGKFATFSDFKNIQEFFQKTYQVYFKITQFLDVLRIFTLLVAFNSNFATFSGFKKVQECFPINSSFFFFKKSQVLNILRNSTISVAFFRKFPLLMILQKFQLSPEKFIEFSLKKPKFRTFWEISVFQSEITANLLHLRILRKPRLSSKIWSFFKKKR